MFLFGMMLGSAWRLGVEMDYAPGEKPIEINTHLDVFMALFMFCTLEVVVLKILRFREEMDEYEESYHRSYRSENSAPEYTELDQH